MGWELGEVVCATLLRTLCTVKPNTSVCLHVLCDLEENESIYLLKVFLFSHQFMVSAILYRVSWSLGSETFCPSLYPREVVFIKGRGEFSPHHVFSLSLVS